MKKKSASQSAPARRSLGEGGFFKLRLLLAVLLCFGAITLVLFAQPRTPSGQSGNSQPIVRAQYRGVMPVVKFDISPPLRSMKPLPWNECTLRENEEQGPILAAPLGPVVPDTAVQRVLGKIGIPAPIISFDGNSNLCGCSPPDPNGAVGPNHVVTMANLHFQIFNKSGTSLFGPAANNTLWSGFGGPCQTQNAGDPVVLYDQLADRWLLTQFTAGSAPFFECVALSQTNDPLGSYYRWAIATGPVEIIFPIIRKLVCGPTPIISAHVNLPVARVGHLQVLARMRLIARKLWLVIPIRQWLGSSCRQTPHIVVGDGLLPSDLDGMTPPPVGSPNYFVGSQDNNAGAPQDALNIFKFHYDPGLLGTQLSC